MPNLHPEEMPDGSPVTRQGDQPNIPPGLINGRRRLSFVQWPDAPMDQPMVSAILVTKDEETGEFHVWLREGIGFNGPDPDLLAMLATHLDMRNLTTGSGGITED
jgi:hypothetical protein